MRALSAIGWIVVAGVVAAACSGSTDTSAEGLTPDQACNDAADAYCGALDKCADPLVQLVYGDAATCASRAKLQCTAQLAAPGNGSTPESLDACAQAVPTATCDDLFNHKPPSACDPVAGSEPNGASCLTSSQCQSTYCNRGGPSCGTCAAAPMTGGACKSNDDCPIGDLCSKSGVCAVPATAGSPCSDAVPCASPNVCINGMCAAAGQTGTACTSGGGECDVAHGFVCNPVSHQCAAFTLVAAGQACGLINNMLVGCKASGNCKIASGSQGTCEAAAADGAACNTTAGPHCMPPATCQNGLCRLPNTTCP